MHGQTRADGFTTALRKKVMNGTMFDYFGNASKFVVAYFVDILLDSDDNST